MATFKFTLEDEEYTSELKKVERKDLYGESRVKTCDKHGQELKKAGIPTTGQGLILNGDLKRATKVNGDYTLEKAMEVDKETGEPVATTESSLKSNPKFTKAAIDDMATFQTESVYWLQDIKIPEGSIWKGSFNYRASVDPSVAFILDNTHGTFLLVGGTKKAAPIGMEADTNNLINTETDDNEGDEDFSNLF